MFKTWCVPAILLTVATTALAVPQRTELDVQSPTGDPVAKIVVCNDCQGHSGEGPCDPGAENGWREGKACGACLLQSNWGVTIKYAQDVRVSGKLVGADGEPVVGRFVKMFLPNGWSVRTRTLSDGSFQMMLGATAPREGSESISVDLGTWTDSEKGDDPHFALYMLPEDYKPCVGGPLEPKGPRPL